MHKRISERHRAEAAWRPRVKVWLEVKGRYVFGYGLSAMLQAVEQSGSIKEAAQRLGKSYRYVWGRIKAAEAAIGQPLVKTHVGGTGTQRSLLTPLGKELVVNFLAFRRRMSDILEREFLRGFRTSKRRTPGPLS